MTKAFIGLAVGVYLGLAVSNGAQALELTLTPVTERSLRITLAQVGAIVEDGIELDLKSKPAGVKISSLEKARSVRVGKFEVKLSPNPLRVVAEVNGETVQDLEINEATGEIQFNLGSGPIFGLGEGGRQFDRRGDNDPMKSSQEGYNKAYFGGRMPVPWILSKGWALFLHSPQGRVDLSGKRGRFTPFSGENTGPVDIFVSAFEQPAEGMTEYARLTGFPSMPPLWALGYEQSHRTTENWDFVLGVARKFREKKLPADVLIYLGTGWAPEGWNKGHRSFEFNPKVFPDPPANLQALRDLHFKVVLHEMGPPKGLYGRVTDTPKEGDPNSVANYWKLHAPLEKLGADGWWPDEGENLSRESRLARIRMYWEGPQQERPDIRPYTLNRAGYAGMQRFGGWLWSGDLNSTWETLKNQVPVGLNTSLTGVPFWGTDAGGFFSTKELTGELYARWFQFATFCPVFRSHGRPSLLRFPWGWNLGEMGEPEASPEVRGSAEPDPNEFHNRAIEPICKKYLDLRYQLLPYIYSAARETHDTGIPMMRALWLYYSDDRQAAARGDEYLWGRDMLVAPVTEKAAVAKRLYLPRGAWYDFWNGERIDGGREVEKRVDLATTPLFVRAGTVLPLGPVKQYSDEAVDKRVVLRVYPGTNGEAILYEDDGRTFAFERGQFMRLAMRWDDQARQLTLRLLPGSKMLQAGGRDFDIEVAGHVADKQEMKKRVHFAGKPVSVRL